MKLRKPFLPKFLTRVQVPLWLVIIIALLTCSAPIFTVFLGQHFESKGKSKIIQQELYSELQAYIVETNSFGEPISDFLWHLDELDYFLEKNASFEMTLFLFDRVLEFQEEVIEINESLKKREMNMLDIVSKQNNEKLKLVLYLRSCAYKFDISPYFESYKLKSESERIEGYDLWHSELFPQIKYYWKDIILRSTILTKESLTISIE